MTRFATALAVLVIACSAAFAALSADDVLVKSEIEAFGLASDLEPIQIPGASGDLAMQLNKPTSRIVGAVKLEPGDYTLMYRVWAPAGDQDGFFVDIRDKRERRVPPGQRSWHTMAYNFAVEKAETMTLAIIVQEIGFVVDQVALVKGTYQTNEVSITDLPGATKSGPVVKPQDLPRFSSVAKLDQVPAGPFRGGEHALFLNDFDCECKGTSGETGMAPGKFGNAVHLGVPDGRYVADTSACNLAGEGTIEFWVKPRVAQQLWWDQGWHYLLHCEPVDRSAEKAFSLDLSRHPMTQLELTARVPGTDIAESIRLSTGGLDINEWHHVLVSWDMNPDRQHLWLMIDGVGSHLQFTPAFAPTKFKRVELGNSPVDGDLPFLFLDGLVDELCVSDVSVASRLEK